MEELKRVVAEGIGAARQASALFEAVTGPVAAAAAGGAAAVELPPPAPLVDEPLVLVLVVLVLVVLVLVVLVLGVVVGVDVEVVGVVAAVPVSLLDAAVEAPLPDEPLLELPHALSANPIAKITK